nr:hypothetical protein [Tanacetum cinerariifolium]
MAKTYRVDAKPSTNNEDKVFNPGILSQENPFEIITRVVQDKKLAISNASLVFEDFDPLLYEHSFIKEVPRSNMLLPFSSENEKKVFKPGIHTSEKVHSSRISELSHQGYKVFKINEIFKSPMKIFLFSREKDTHTLDVHCLHFYPLDLFKNSLYFCCMVLYVQYSQKFEDSYRRILSPVFISSASIRESYFSLKDSIDQSNLANLVDNFVDYMPEMFIDEYALDYSSLPIFDEYDDDFLEVESDTENIYDDPFDSKGEKIKESKLLIDKLDLPCDFLPSEYDSFISEDFSRDDAKPSTNNEDKVFNPGVLSQENPFEIITRVVQDKKLAISNASLGFEDFDPPLYELCFFKEVPRSNMVLPFSSENEKKVFKPGIHTSKKVHSS